MKEAILKLYEDKLEGYRNILRDIQRANAIVQLQEAWIPVDKQEPDDGLAVLIATEDGDVWTGFLDSGRWHYDSSGHPVGQKVTHWMDFPPHPYDNDN